MGAADLGVQVTLLAGKSLPVPVSSDVVRALRRAEITQHKDGGTYFQLRFEATRTAGIASMELDLISDGSLDLGSRIVLAVTLSATLLVLADGFVSHHEVGPSGGPNAVALTVTGEDVSVQMDLNGGTPEQFPGQSVKGVVDTILMRYASLGVSPDTTAPPGDAQQSATGLVYTRTVSDRAYLRALADRYAYVFQLRPDVPTRSVAYWGPRPTTGAKQPALSTNMGPFTNVASLSASSDALAATQLTGQRDDGSGTPVDVGATAYAGGSLSKDSSALSSAGLARTRLFGVSGASPTEAQVLAQAELDRSARDGVRLQGELDTARYGQPLEAWSLVDVRGLGATYDGTYYVEELTHVLERGSYRQRFSLVREGTGAASPLVQT